MGYHNILSQICILTILPSLLVCVDGIIVHWNTNTGPIVPPTSTPIPIPQKPYRDPAPVWEDQSNDLPNPNQYRYVPPPPSRPRLNNVNIFSNNIDNKPVPIDRSNQPDNNYGKIINNISQNNNYNTVPSLSIQYIPNYGFKYYAVVPEHKSAYLKTNDIQPQQQQLQQQKQQYQNNDKYYYNNKYDKYQDDKFNAKLRKYKDYKKYISVAQQQQYQPSTQQTVYHHQHNTQQQQPQPTVFTQQAQAQQQPQPTVFQAQQHQQHFLQQEPQPTQQQNFNYFNKSYSQKGFTNNNKL